MRYLKRRSQLYNRIFISQSTMDLVFRSEVSKLRCFTMRRRPDDCDFQLRCRRRFRNKANPLMNRLSSAQAYGSPTGLLAERQSICKCGYAWLCYRCVHTFSVWSMCVCAVESRLLDVSAKKSFSSCTSQTELGIDILSYTLVAKLIPHQKVLWLLYAYVVMDGLVWM